MINEEMVLKDEVNVNIWLTIAIPLLSIITTYSISYLRERLGLLVTIIILVIVFAFISSIVYFVTVTCTSVGYNERLISELDKGLNNVIKSNNTKIGLSGLKGVYLTENVFKSEASKKYNEIWFVSHDLLNEISSSTRFKLVKEYLDSGTKCSFFLPYNDMNEHRASILKMKCDNSSGLNMYFLPKSFFFLVPELEFIIYEPLSFESEGKKGYISLNIVGKDERYSAVLDKGLTDAISSKLSKCIK